MGYAKQYQVERYFRESRLPRLAPVSQEMVLNYLSQHVLSLANALAVAPGVGASTVTVNATPLRSTSLMLTAWRGRAAQSVELIEASVQDVDSGGGPVAAPGNDRGLPQGRSPLHMTTMVRAAGSAAGFHRRGVVPS
jgi:hypothetical protein